MHGSTARWRAFHQMHHSAERLDTFGAIDFMGIFQHAKLRTPRWLGYVVQRPESHTLHHGRGLHRYNYADLPLIDMLFGTFRNPATFTTRTGFYDGASARVAEMLTFRDVSEAEQTLPEGTSPTSSLN